MGQAFDFALDKMGIDISSYSIYNDYVQFLKGVDAQGNYAENQKISAVRRVYQRGILIPMANIESFWKDYLNYEQVEMIAILYSISELYSLPFTILLNMASLSNHFLEHQPNVCREGHFRPLQRLHERPAGGQGV